MRYENGTFQTRERVGKKTKAPLKTGVLPGRSTTSEGDDYEGIGPSDSMAAISRENNKGGTG